jgi:hypothetical protein
VKFKRHEKEAFSIEAIVSALFVWSAWGLFYMGFCVVQSCIHKSSQFNSLKIAYLAQQPTRKSLGSLEVPSCLALSLWRFSESIGFYEVKQLHRYQLKH